MYLVVFWCPFVIYLPMPEQESEKVAIISNSRLNKGFRKQQYNLHRQIFCSIISEDWSYEAVKIRKAIYAEHKNSHAFTVTTPGT